jgi:superfamily II DNA or RNA helicase
MTLFDTHTERINLRPYQTEAKDQTIVGFETCDKGLVVIPTGGGKTILFAHLAEHYQPGRTLILAHREELLTQAVDKIQRATGLWSEVEKAERKASFDAPVVVASVQTLARRADRWPEDHFDLIVVDEAHHVLADSYLNVLSRFDSHAKVLGVTATPDRGDKKNLGKYFERVFYEVTLTKLIKDGYLSPLTMKMLPIKIDMTGVKKVGGDLAADEVAERIEPWLERVADEIAAEAWDRKTILFLPLVKTAERMRDILNRRGIASQSVSGYDTDREQRLGWFANAKPGSVLCNSMLLTEGFDQPDVDCIVNLRPTQVRSLYAQMVGRGTRLHPGKKDCLLLDFLWQSEKMSLVTAARLFSQNAETIATVEKQMFEAAEMAGGGGEVDIMEACESVEEQRMKKVVQALKDNRKRPPGTYDVVQMCLSLGSPDLVEYEPMSPREARPATTNQLACLEKAGFDPGSVRCFGHASAILDRLAVRRLEGLATPKQVRLMERFGHPDAANVTFAEARRWIDVEMSARR